MSFETEWRVPDLTKFPATDTEKSVARAYVRVLLLEQDDGCPQEYPVQMAIGVQFFKVGTGEDPQHADWISWQLAKALTNLLTSNISAYLAEIDRLNLLVEECREQRDKARNDAIETVQAEVAGLRRKLAQKTGDIPWSDETLR